MRPRTICFREWSFISRRLERAEELARRAIELDPLNYQPRTSLARVLWVQGKVDAAEDSARKAVELQPTASGSHRWLVFVAISRADGAAALREARWSPTMATSVSK